MDVVIVAECSKTTGQGHLVRCCDIAETLLRRGVEVCLVSVGPRWSTRLVRQRTSAHHIVIPFSSGIKDGRALGDCLRALRPAVLISDMLEGENQGHLWSLFRKVSKTHITISDQEPPRDVPSDIDIRINPNHAISPERSPRRQKLYCGLDYFVANPDIVAARKSRRYSSRVKRIVMCFGGGRHSSAALNAALAGLELIPAALDITVVKSAASGGDIKQRRSLHKIRWASDLPAVELAKVIYSADLQVSAASNVAYEALLLGTPLVLINIVQRQNFNAGALAAAGAAINLGMHHDVRPESLALAVTALSANASRRKTLGSAGQQLVDGQGLTRIIEIVESHIS